MRSEYDAISTTAARFSATVTDQLQTLVAARNFALGVPIEKRVKEWSSIVEKLERKKLKVNGIRTLDDLIGIRLILLFRRDVNEMHSILDSNFKVISYEDTSARLEEMQFGYHSVHYIVELPDEWLSVPTMASFGGMKAEIQVRTLSQHIWAAASHKLQYKRESSVPVPLRRSINRVSAILETVDLEFERLLESRDAYVLEFAAAKDDRELNVDIVRDILQSKWPPSNREQSENSYSAFVDELRWFGITTSSALNRLIDEQYAAVMKDEKKQVEDAHSELREHGTVFGTTVDRTTRGVFFTLMGLTRGALSHAFPKQWEEYSRTLAAHEDEAL